MDAPRRNLYAPPTADVGNGLPVPAASAGKLYSPGQVRLGAFLGGPIAALYFLRENFRVLGKDRAVRMTMVWGIVCVVGLIMLLPLLPNRLPNTLVPLLYCIAAGWVADNWQLKKQAIIDSGSYQIQSNWRVVGVTLLGLVAFVPPVMLAIFLLSALGWMSV